MLNFDALKIIFMPDLQFAFNAKISFLSQSLIIKIASRNPGSYTIEWSFFTHKKLVLSNFMVFFTPKKVSLFFTSNQVENLLVILYEDVKGVSKSEARL